MDRRQLLARLPLFGAAVALPAVAATSPVDRMAYHLAEFQKAAQEADPTIAAWHVHPGFNPSQLRFQVTAITERAIEWQDSMGYLVPIREFHHIDGHDLSHIEPAPLFASDVVRIGKARR